MFAWWVPGGDSSKELSVVVMYQHYTYLCETKYQL